MGTVYIVTDGEYSSYHIEAVFSTRDAAQKFIDARQCTRDVEIEEYELDVGDQTGPLTVLCMDRQGESWGHHTIESRRPITCHNLDHWLGRDVLRVHVATGDHAQAIKVANEIRGQLIATEVWNVVDA